MRGFMENVAEQKIKDGTLTGTLSKESLYRTKWLMAHNRLHRIAHDPSATVADEWKGYLNDLGTAESVASRAA